MSLPLIGVAALGLYLLVLLVVAEVARRARRDKTPSDHFLAARDQGLPGIGGEEAVASDFLAADDALEQAGGRPGVDLVKGADGRQRVADQPTAYGDQVVIGGKPAEDFEVGKMGHR